MRIRSCWMIHLSTKIVCLLVGWGLLACLAGFSYQSTIHREVNGCFSEFNQTVAARKMTCGTNMMESCWNTLHKLPVSIFPLQLSIHDFQQQTPRFVLLVHKTHGFLQIKVSRLSWKNGSLPKKSEDSPFYQINMGERNKENHLLLIGK